MSNHNTPLSGAEDTLLNADTRFDITEAFKTLRTNLLFAMAASGRKKDGKSNTVCISSSLPMEGKSTVSANLAISMAEKNEKVLLIDADLRKPHQNKLFAVSNACGLSSLLTEDVPVSTAVIKDIRPNLDLLPTGTIPPNPSELLSSTIMGELLRVFAHVYDFVFIDTPPVNVVSDPLVTAVNTAGLVIVVRPGICRHDNIKRTLDAIKLANVNLLGVVMSAVQDDEMQYGRGYSRNHYYRHSYDSYSSRKTPAETPNRSPK